ncbi:MAG: Pycsar system effector family protein [Candidatus Kerfeldbacteria bacterium]
MNKPWDILRNINEFVRFSDTKAAIVLAFASGSVAFLSTKAEVLHTIMVEHRGDGLGWLLYLAAFCYLVSLIATVIYSLRSIWPSLGSTETRSLIFFKHVFEDFGADHKAYAERLRSLNEASYLDELSHQICANASIATKKYDLVGKAIQALTWTIGSWGVIIFIILVTGAVTPT